MRIIGGKCRGFILAAPKGRDTRPTQDRVREALFNVLENMGLYGTRVLDAFAGTGALALEALSRGAESAVAVDIRTAKIIRENAQKCKLEDAVQIFAEPIEKVLCRHAGEESFRFDYVFLDPPYHTDLIEKTLAALVKYQCLAESAIIILEQSNDEPDIMGDEFEVYKSKRYGSTKLTFLRYQGKEAK